MLVETQKGWIAKAIEEEKIGACPLFFCSIVWAGYELKS
jgi:hypothetical protein